MKRFVVSIFAVALLGGNSIAAPSKGSQISMTPVVESRLFLGQEEYFVKAVPSGERAGLDLELRGGSPDRMPWDAEKQAAWDLDHPLVDVMGDGHFAPVEWQFYERWLPSLTGAKGAEKLTWRWNGTWNKGSILELYSYENGLEKPRLVWASEPENGMHPGIRPYTLIGDFDGDGNKEIAISRAGGISILDSRTGKRKTEITYRKWPGHHRYYGWFGAYPNPQGKGTLFVVVGIFSGHVDVVSYDGKQLHLVWIHLFDPKSDQGIDRRYSIDRLLPDPVVDADGDGRKEILLNVFNDTGDRRWHVTGYDLASGKVTVDLPDHYVRGLFDDTNGRKGLLCRVLPTRAEPAYSPLEMVKLVPGRPAQALWRTELARLSRHPIQQQPLNLWLNAMTGGGPDSVDFPLTLGRTADKAVFYLSRPDGEGERLEAWEVGEGLVPRSSWLARLQGKGTVEAVTVGPDQKQVLLKVHTQGKNRLELEGATGELVWSRLQRSNAAPTLGLIEAGPRGQVIIAGDVFRRVNLLTEEKGKLTNSKTLKGWLSSLTGEKRSASPEAADLDGDGFGEMLLARDGPDGAANLVVVGLDGKERWSKRFSDFGADGVRYWQSGHFRSRDRLDVVVTLARSLMHSDETFLLDGRTGETIWHRDRLEVKNPPHTRAFGGGAFAAADFDGDGRDELVLCHPAELSVTDGATGETRAIYNMGPIPEADLAGSFWVIGGIPLTADLDGDGRPEILWTTNTELLSAFKYDQGGLKMMWHGEKNQGSLAMPAVTHLAGGEVVIGGSGYPDGFRALNGKDGSLRWSVPLSGTPVSNTLAFVPGKLKEAAFLYAVGNNLYARAAHDGKEIWQVELPGPAVQLLLLEARSPRKNRILVSTQQGEVLLLEEAAKRE